MSKSVQLCIVCALSITLVIVALTACSTKAPAPTAPPAPPTTAPSAPTVAPTTAPEASTPMAEPTVAATATLTPTARTAPVVKPTEPVAKLDFTEDDIEYAPSAKRKGDNKIQLTIRLHPKGGKPPFSIILDGGSPIGGLTYTFDWHNCNETEPHTIAVVSGDGQQSKPVGFMYPYRCD